MRDAAAALVHPLRRRILDALRTPGSATSVAQALALSRQVVNYHVRALERAGLVEEVGARQRRGLTERLVRATAPSHEPDRFGPTYQVAVAARTIREVASLGDLARQAGTRLTTLTVDTTVTLASPRARRLFAEDLVSAINAVVVRHHTPDAPNSRAYRLFAGAHPMPAPEGSREGR